MCITLNIDNTLCFGLIMTLLSYYTSFYQPYAVYKLWTRLILEL